VTGLFRSLRRDWHCFGAGRESIIASSDGAEGIRPVAGLMKIGLLQVDLYLAGCQSLKDKRTILQSVKHRLRSKYNVSVAEIGDHDIWRRSRFGVVAIGNGTGSIEETFRSVVREFESRGDTAVTDYRIEMI